MGIKTKVSALIEHVYCAMCGQEIYVPVSLSDAQKREIEKYEKTIQMQVMCPGCGHKTEVRIGKDNISLKEVDI